MRYRFYTADVFTDRPFGGNQLAVLPDARGLSDGQMQSVAREFNYSETVFALPPQQTGHTRSLRIFTPAAEVPFAGHPTVGAAFILARTGHIPVVDGRNEIVLEEPVGPISVVIEVVDGQPRHCQLTAAQPLELFADVPELEAIAALLSVPVAEIGNGVLQPRFASCGLPFLYVPLASPEVVSRARLALDRWHDTLGSARSDMVYLFAPGGAAGSDIHGRMFAPGVGVPEDPATGSAAVSLAGYLAAFSDATEGTLRWIVEQGVEMGRPSILHAEADLVGGKVVATRVGGPSVLVSEGSIEVPQEVS